MSFFDKEYVERTFTPYRWDEAKERIPSDYGIPKGFTDEEIREWNRSYPARRDALFTPKEVEVIKDEEMNLDTIIY